MKNRMFRSLSWLLVLSMLASVLLLQFPMQANADTTTEPPDAASVDIQDGVTLHCWNWSFKEIEANMEIIAALGYTTIQTSPIQQAKEATVNTPVNGNWWVFYQPASFSIDSTGESALGTKDDFKRMCQKADEYGIKVIVDIVANHMGESKSGGLADTIIDDLRNDASCWHDITKDTQNYSSRQEVTQYCMAGLPDLNTSNDKVQNYVLELLKECIDAGADGFRFDAAKHIETPDDGALASDFWPTVINGAKEYAQTNHNFELYCYGELLDNVGGGLTDSVYTQYMSVTDNNWCADLLSSIRYGSAATVLSGYCRTADASQLVLWAESHDTYADQTTFDIPVEIINKTWALVAAREGAMGLYLARPANFSQYLGAASNTGWAYPEVAAANRFHTQFIGQSESMSKEGDVAYVERGTSGVILVNCKGNEGDVSVTAKQMADGTYTDAITGNTFTVADGKISGSIGSTGIAVVYECESCAHEAHDSEGFCTACAALVGHEYDENRTCACGDVLVSERTVYFVNSAKWRNIHFYAWYDAVDIVTDGWPGNPATHVEGDIYSCVIPSDVPFLIFNNGDSGLQTDDLEVPAESSGLNMFDYSVEKWKTYGQTEEPNPAPAPTPAPTTPAPAKAPSQSVPVWIIAVSAVAAIAIVVVLFVVKKKK